ncbi:MAG: molybdopterin molybdotransferase MoeA [Alphaproteobacteria bacterium]|jgi:molybdopterin molybdotransferase|nr:molybdopterin molybdotransferase MoeA [Rhodospirillaceae bacterium]MDG2481654.1 molybdopterin molybdotransferase MoeA [Alphaproteobacteria bacterium]MBT6204841.1 molybdopterin molybdotransferase MoeA [Rhodospirillaceae bacterium]MBT6510670.1 molybdopterin molybdotransferase MoeA [Rhodospirillaceae bacterium]MBT7615353.1 molybdopterin molybdotransferase MoeA [Rhodospirillaceae bacterium]
MAQLTDDCFAHGDRLMTADEALALIGQIAAPVTGLEEVGLAIAPGRILARDVVSTVDVPPHPNAAVDGYAFFHDDLVADADTTLPVTGRVPAGHALGRPAAHGEAIRIFTGAPMPEGLDTVMMQEDTQEADGMVTLPTGIKPGANRRNAGEDVRAGTVILKAGHRLKPQDVGMAASVGLAALPCHATLKVALFSTGDEVCEPGEPLEPGAIYDANRYAVMGLLRGLGCSVTDLGILPDKGPQTHAAIAEAASSHHALMTSGGVSVGDEDHVRKTIMNEGTLHAWYMAIKPGRPLMLGQIGGAAFIGLPGNPAAAMVTFLRFARPLLLRLGGGKEVDPQLFSVRAAFDRKKKSGRREYVRVHLEYGDDGVLEAHAFHREGAGLLSSLVETDGLAELPEDMTQLEKGAMIDVLPFSEVIG